MTSRGGLVRSPGAPDGARHVPPGRGDTARATVDELLAVARALGDDVVVAVEASGTSLRRRVPFARVEARAGGRVRLELHLPEEPGTERLHRASGPATHGVEVAGPDDVDDELVAWLRAASERAG